MCPPEKKNAISVMMSLYYFLKEMQLEASIEMV